MSLECDVVLSSNIDIPVTVNVIWIGPNSDVPMATNQTLVNKGTTLIAVMITFASFGRMDSGNYTCTGFLSSTSLFLNTSQSLSSTIMVTTGTEELKFNNNE